MTRGTVPPSDARIRALEAKLAVAQGKTPVAFWRGLGIGALIGVGIGLCGPALVQMIGGWA